MSRRCQQGGAPDDPTPMLETPDFRVTIHRRRLLAVDWHPWLASSGPMTTMLQERARAGVAIADVTVLHEDEVAAEAIVRFLARDDDTARGALRGWARDVGYRRLWLPDEVVELPGPAEQLAETRCSGCCARLYDDGPRFWQHVREVGRFPASCPLCGADLPQWRVRQTGMTASDPDVMPADRSRRTSCS